MRNALPFMASQSGATSVKRKSSASHIFAWCSAVSGITVLTFALIMPSRGFI